MLDDIKKKGRPFTVPEGYFATLEDQVREKITPQQPQVNPFWSIMKTGMAMALSFLFVFGMGKGVMTITQKMGYSTLSAETDDLATLIENGYIRHDFVDYLYDEIEIEGAFPSENIELYDELSQKIESRMSEMELMEYIENE